MLQVLNYMSSYFFYFFFIFFLLCWETPKDFKHKKVSAGRTFERAWGAFLAPDDFGIIFATG